MTVTIHCWKQCLVGSLKEDPGVNFEGKFWANFKLNIKIYLVQIKIFLWIKVKDDWSPHEIALANILHREIFEDGTYFKTVEISTFKNKHSASKKSRKCRESSEEDEGFEVRNPMLWIILYPPLVWRKERAAIHMLKWSRYPPGII